MQFMEDEIRRITEDVFGMILGLAAVPAPATVKGPIDGRTYSAAVQISGAWEGVVHLLCPASLAARATSIMFGLEASETTSLEQTQDAVGEITNMLGGNFKGLLPGPCRLSLPTVVEGDDYLLRIPNRTTVTTELAFTCEGQAFVVTLLSKDAA